MGASQQQPASITSGNQVTPEMLAKSNNVLPASLVSQIKAEQANSPSVLAAQQKALADQQTAGLQKQETQGDTLSAQQSAAYSNFSPEKYAQQIGQLNAYNAQRMGANAGKAARIGNFGQQGALAEGERQKMAMGGAATAATGQQQDIYGRIMGQAGNQQLGLGQLGVSKDTLALRKEEDAQSVQDRQYDRAMAERDKVIGGITGAAGSGAQLLATSDERAKENIKPVSLMDMAKNIKPVSFKYKATQGDGGKHIGVIAQDLEKSPATENTVKEVDTPDGKRKAIDTNELSTVNTGAISELARHIIKLENELNKRGK